MTVPHGAMRMCDAAEKAAAEAAPFAPALPFALVSGEETLVGRGCLGLVEDGPSPFGERARALIEAEGAGPRLVVGALPFDRAAAPHLYRPAELSRSAGRSCFAAAFPPPSLVRGAAPPPRWEVTPEPSLVAYESAVAEALSRMARREEGLRKIVLSRSLRLLADRAIDASALLRALSEDASVTAFCVPLVAAGSGEASRALVGATPELLLSKRGARVVSHPLAGSARRAREDAADRAAAEGLLASEKDRREHREVVTAILDLLAPYCTELAAPEAPALAATASMWHLGTRIVGRLRDAATSALDLAALLHPTPAVCGTPRAAAARAIAELEGYERGFYAGAVGWCDAAGDGAWHVAIRCAEIAGREARLFAGAGIVPGSDPVAEGEETSAKFAALLGALGIDEHGRVRSEEQA